MTPKDKAEELVNKHDECLNNIAIGSNGIEHHLAELAKQCALISVDELIEYAETWGDATELDINYFNEVKNEINKL